MIWTQDAKNLLCCTIMLPRAQMSWISVLEMWYMCWRRERMAGGQWRGMVALDWFLDPTLIKKNDALDRLDGTPFNNTRQTRDAPSVSLNFKTMFI
ncbi:unnamed protein product [Staurois parvus]|uniref:Uncharacterized protein n=1 Tax=Staurois parvus TaxID=386267 RepID=A0ABN9E6Y7_9NEOB|nr:unnamed protein product [Staurois parvus]